MKASEPDTQVFVAYYDMVGWILDRVEQQPHRGITYQPRAQPWV